MVEVAAVSIGLRFFFGSTDFPAADLCIGRESGNAKISPVLRRIDEQLATTFPSVAGPESTLDHRRC